MMVEKHSLPLFLLRMGPDCSRKEFWIQFSCLYHDCNSLLSGANELAYSTTAAAAIWCANSRHFFNRSLSLSHSTHHHRRRHPPPSPPSPFSPHFSPCLDIFWISSTWKRERKNQFRVVFFSFSIYSFHYPLYALMKERMKWKNTEPKRIKEKNKTTSERRWTKRPKWV